MRAPLFLPYEIPDMGRRATVIDAGPRVRDYPGAPEDGGRPVLAAGSELLLRDGPVAFEGYDWYWAYFRPPDNESQFGPQSGWVAAGLSGDEPTLMEIGPARCPAVPVTVALMGSMTDMARRECLGEGSFEVHGVLESCYFDGIVVFAIEPRWFGSRIGSPCYLAYEPGTNIALPIRFPPLLLIPGGLSRGDLVRMVGHVNDPAANDCVLVPIEEGPATASTWDQELAVLTCNSAFVVTEIEVIGHMDLANPFGF